ncbi:MAG: rod shape-determining protein [Candidatus Nealsonbacteria bacterium RIFCSPLOWO2_12_FULL_39_31]|uniref:Cell shape-determining protein MreB n=3 Tax=Candidatus Nealsoniibacteriota TaxID=1817911 RepID=A0A1G2EIP1_9BACT|nr:MAG: Cell shape determining protein, MreB/Mrl family [Parcubacteria group bacterium GW2011_GWA2_38_27]KKQ98058.1 MAG: Cell shape determining protein, MreB/Mrl family [Parcubacteria group bacterium GW2011_GWC2_39_11]OGZ19448.1 MAG: rod shape-determining protein [Candidatus Nealsonbacteria bacterium RIFCSPHIGHO2_01_FULL_38_55]OGZ21469.1 MAG: rod shape-determining protein [Candidatus Nealsonbacteria bacterium RIFCSPHIGHO2_02_FULL_38_75]OGZ22616.1 MAG: rod shape-determining protein [Candidatus N
MFVRKIGVDLGTCNSIVFTPQKGVVLNEPSVVAVSISENRILAVGREAKEMMGRTPDAIRVYRPLRDGVIADYRVTEAMLKYFIKRGVRNFRFLKPELLIGVPAGITSTEKRAVIEAGMTAGARGVYVAKEPILAAIGAGIPINSCSGHMIIDIGGGTSEVAIISLGGIVTCRSLRVAGDKLDVAIAEYIKKKHNLAIGEQTAEEIKIKIGTALQEKEEREMEIRGRDLISGLPHNIKVSSGEVCEAISERLAEMVQVVKEVLRETPPELSSDIMDKGMIISGGGALLRNIDELIAEATGVPCFLAEEPLFCVAKGTGAVLDNLEIYKQTIMAKR